MLEFFVLFGAGLIAGGMNALAGGGTFVSFPALVWAGVPGVAANASSTVAIFPGTITSAWAYRRDVRSIGDVPLRLMLIISMIGGGVGALLLLLTPEARFGGVVPWLLLIACVTFAFGARLGALLRRYFRVGRGTLLVCQFLLGLYGGYFGGAVGIMLMAVWGLLGDLDVKEMNPAKVILAGSMNAVAVVFFIVAGAVRWRETLVMLAAAALGGYGGARLARHLNPHHIRTAVILISSGMTFWFFTHPH